MELTKYQTGKVHGMTCEIYSHYDWDRQMRRTSRCGRGFPWVVLVMGVLLDAVTF